MGRSKGRPKNPVETPAVPQPRWPPEMETLDQLSGADMPLSEIRRYIFSDDREFLHSIHQMILSGNVLLRTAEGQEVESWRLRELFDGGGALLRLSDLWLSLTPQGIRYIG